jgi:hypothetical protein
MTFDRHRPDGQCAPPIVWNSPVALDGGLRHLDDDWMPAAVVTNSADQRRAMSTASGTGRVLWMARRVVFDRWSPCACGAARRLVSERAIVAGEALPQWVVISEACSAGC